MKKIVLILTALALGFGGWSLFQRAERATAETPLPQPPTWTVRVEQPKVRRLRQSARFLARVEARNKASVASKLSGRIGQLLVREGQRVKQGDLLLRIDDSEIRASIEGLRASLDSARGQRDYRRRQLQRNRELHKTGGVSKDLLEASEAAYQSAVATVNELLQKIRGLENQLEYSRIQAPFDAVVGQVFQHEGDLAVPGKPILSLNSLPQKLILRFVPGAAPLQPGQPVWADGAAIGRLASIYDDAEGGLWLAEVELDRRLDQPIGSYLDIDVLLRSGEGCSVPLQALLHRPDRSSVMRFDGERFVEQAVRVEVTGQQHALISPCVEQPVAVAAEARLALLPAAGARVRIRGDENE